MKVIGFLTLVAICISLYVIDDRLSKLDKRILELRQDLIISACKD